MKKNIQDEFTSFITLVKLQKMVTGMTLDVRKS